MSETLLSLYSSPQMRLRQSASGFAYATLVSWSNSNHRMVSPGYRSEARSASEIPWMTNCVGSASCC